MAIGKHFQPESHRTVISFDLDGNVEWQNDTPASPKFWSDTTPMDLGDDEVLIASRWEVLDAETGDTVLTPPPLAVLEDHEAPQILDVTRSAPVALSVLSPDCPDCNHGAHEVLFLDDALEVQSRWEVPTGHPRPRSRTRTDGLWLVSAPDSHHATLFHLVDGDVALEEVYCGGLYDIEAVDDTLIFLGWTGLHEKMIRAPDALIRPWTGPPARSPGGRGEADERLGVCRRARRHPGRPLLGADAPEGLRLVRRHPGSSLIVIPLTELATARTGLSGPNPDRGTNRPQTARRDSRPAV